MEYGLGIVRQQTLQSTFLLVRRVAFLLWVVVILVAARICARVRDIMGELEPSRWSYLFENHTHIVRCVDGWTGPMANLDFSNVVIEQMKERYNSAANKVKPDMEFMCHDVTTGLPFPDESFDLIICKGSFDAVLCSAGSVANIRKLVQESVRCLVPGHGVFFVVSNGNPDNRLVHLEHENDINFYWDGVSCHTVERPNGQ